MEEIYLATLNTVQVILLAWIGSEAKLSRDERNRRQRQERGEE